MTYFNPTANYPHIQHLIAVAPEDSQPVLKASMYKLSEVDREALNKALAIALNGSTIQKSN